MSSPPPSQLENPPRRLSRFTEGDETTLSTSTSHSETNTPSFSLLTILHEMDDYEQRLRKRGNSNSSSSFESFTSSTASSPKEASPLRTSEDVGHGARRSGTWGVRSEDQSREGIDLEGLKIKVKGRLRALTVERRGATKGSPYPGT